MFEVYFACDGERNENMEIAFNTYEEAMNYVLSEQDKYSDDCYFEIHDVKYDRWY